MVEIAKMFVLGLAVISLLGGIMGFVKAQSRASLIAGSISAALLGVCYFVTLSQPNFGLIGAAIVATLLEVHFVRSYMKKKKPMPAIPMIVCSALTEVVALIAVALEIQRTGHL
ncbi:MAG: TMEM14 family protein [Cyanobacteria bacterium SZAS LIN-2]|nr:TMEM14 family protein [Cyanobacteria bacterium SZAS LIN-3]MBS1995172.1 TMEM14 family protein [Cyanobacteria bacterium SZAS LIN-2]MBS2008908.1 TMEM14 family protein [Cyanobacteria bacterium SZAS TMP-1]